LASIGKCSSSYNVERVHVGCGLSAIYKVYVSLNLNYSVADIERESRHLVQLLNGGKLGIGEQETSRKRWLVNKAEPVITSWIFCCCLSSIMRLK
jgi:hypothetical protein